MKPWMLAALLVSTMAAAAPALAGCDPTADTLGVARTVEIDTTGGPRYGDQYPPQPLLQPGEVVLTFDDGPNPDHTRPILDALAAQCTKATFFVVGSMAKAFPEILRAIHDEGHTIGTHTWSHANLAHRSLEKSIWQIESTFQVADQVLPGKIAPFFRFPYLSDDKRVLAYLASRNVAVFSIDVDSVDYRARTTDRVLRNVANGLAKSNGGIMLFHDIHGNTARALPSVLAELKAKDLKVVHLVAKAPAAPVATAAPSATPRPVARSNRVRRLRAVD